MAETLFSPQLWQRVNEHFRASGQFYVDAPRSKVYKKKQRLMYERFPKDLSVAHQAAYLAKNLVNLQRYPDANKRTASILVEVFLETVGYELTCRDTDYADFLLKVQRLVPSEAWDGRTFTLKADYVTWHDDRYHAFLLSWMSANTKKKS